jgi:hypothetical protein
MTNLVAVGVIGKGAPAIAGVVAIVLFVLATLAALYDLRAQPAPRWFWAPLVAAGLAFLVLALMLSPSS